MVVKIKTDVDRLLLVSKLKKVQFQQFISEKIKSKGNQKEKQNIYNLKKNFNIYFYLWKIKFKKEY